MKGAQRRNATMRGIAPATADSNVTETLTAEGARYANGAGQGASDSTTKQRVHKEQKRDNERAKSSNDGEEAPGAKKQKTGE